MHTPSVLTDPLGWHNFVVGFVWRVREGRRKVFDGGDGKDCHDKDKTVDAYIELCEEGS